MKNPSEVLDNVNKRWITSLSCLDSMPMDRITIPTLTSYNSPRNVFSPIRTKSFNLPSSMISAGNPRINVTPSSLALL